MKTLVTPCFGGRGVGRRPHFAECKVPHPLHAAVISHKAYPVPRVSLNQSPW